MDSINESARGSSLSEQVFQVLEADIIAGRLAPGEALTELKLCQQFGVSRTPVRDALRMLEQKSLVSISPNRGTVVLGISERDLLDIYIIREYVEGLAARWAAEKADARQLNDLRETVELQEFYLTKNSAERMSDMDSRFHRALYELSGSRPLGHILTDLHRQITRYRVMSFNAPERAPLVVAEHKKILQAIEARDGDAAAAYMSEHISAARQYLMHMLKKEESANG